MRIHLLRLVIGVLLSVSIALGQDAAISYQGRLLDHDSPAAGDYDLQFSLFDAREAGNPVGRMVTQENVAVTNGLFTVWLDFGEDAFGAAPCWIQIDVRPHLEGATYTPLVPRQEVGAAPRALSAQSAERAFLALSVTPGVVTSEGIADSAVTIGKIASGQVVTSVNGLKDEVVLDSGTNITFVTEGNTLVVSSLAWGLQGNGGTRPGQDFLGTSDNQPLELRVNNLPALRLDPQTNGAAINVIAGHSGNRVDPGFWGVTISGGGVSYGPGYDLVNHAAGTYATIGGGAANENLAVDGTVSGGFSNRISGGAVEGVIAGGLGNTILNDAMRGTISGGFQNTIGMNCNHSSIGGGWDNVIEGEASTVAGGIQNSIGSGAQFSTISGGAGNVIEATAFTGTIGGGGSNRIEAGSYRCTIGGGKFNTVGIDAPFSSIGGGFGNRVATGAAGAAIPGGTNNVVGGAFGFAAGRGAQANDPGTFVWADSTETSFASQGTNEFAVRATGGVRFVTAIDGTGAPLAGVTLAPGSGSWSSLSDRHSKEHLEAVDSRAILEKVAALPLHRWSYISQGPEVRHLGPMAQDFRAAFGLGEDERAIASVDADGVALAAVQGLHRMVQAQAEEIHARDERITRLEQELHDLKALLQAGPQTASTRWTDGDQP
jgi:trimeric autotransporter adhesin